MAFRRLRSFSQILKCCAFTVVVGHMCIVGVIIIMLMHNTDQEEPTIEGHLRVRDAPKKIPSDHNYHIKHFVLLGKLQPHREVIVTIGIVTVARPNGTNYLHETLQSLLAVSSYEKEKLRVLLLLPIANTPLLEYLSNNYTKHLESGLLVVIGPVPELYYPPLQGLPRSYDDPPERIQWRAKQNLDYAFLWRLAVQTKSQYFLQLEDDVKCTDNYFSKLMNFVNERKNEKPWALMEFSKLGFIGKFFKMADLNKMAALAYHFYAEQPVDFLVQYFKLIMNQKDVISDLSLFQHMGVVSSLAGKEQLLVDEHFEAKDLNADNPPVSLSTNMNSELFPLEKAYYRSQGFFWYDNPKLGDWILLKFHDPQDIRTLRFESGNPAHPLDSIHSARVTYSVEHPNCESYLYAGAFTEGRFEMQDKNHVSCVMVTLSAPQDKWLLVRDIAVYVQNPK